MPEWKPDNPDKWKEGTEYAEKKGSGQRIFSLGEMYEINPNAEHACYRVLQLARGLHPILDLSRGLLGKKFEYGMFVGTSSDVKWVPDEVQKMLRNAVSPSKVFHMFVGTNIGEGTSEQYLFFKHLY